MSTFEDLIDDLGGMGKFQFLTTFCIVSCQITIGWSMLQMAYAGKPTDFTCHHGNTSSNTWHGGTNTSLLLGNATNVCQVEAVECSVYSFHGDDATAIAEWGLVCDRKWVKATIMSVQMAGVLAGALLAGQVGDYFGRRKSLYSFVLFHAVCNFIAAMSTSWMMFAVLRFFIGIGIGAIVVIVLPYPMEFLPTKWRPILSILPSWIIGVAMFSGAALILKDWSQLHIACAVCSLPSLLGVFFVPESIRWLATQGKIEEAAAVFEQMARLNGKPLPSYTESVLHQIVKKERKSIAEMHQYSYIDIFRGWRMARTTIIITFYWFSMALSFYGISFGVGSLFGNFYLNMFLLGVLEFPIQIITFFLLNKFGRRYTAMFFFSMCSITCVGCILAHKLAGPEIRGPAITALSLAAKMMVGSSWSCIQTWGSESYPTVIRNLGYGFTNVGARVGGIIAPFVIDFDHNMARSYSIMAALFVVCTFSTLGLAETKGKGLADSLEPSYDSFDRQSDTSTDGDASSENEKLNDSDLQEKDTMYIKC